ncbi:hypothetical protein D3C76_1743500 [compost metagenome]
MQRQFTDLVDVNGGVGAQPRQFQHLADQFRAVARQDAQGIARFVVQSGIGQRQGKHAGFLVGALLVQVQVTQQA